MKKIALALACVAATAALLPGAARAGDAALAHTYITWSFKVSWAAQELKDIDTKTPTEALQASNRLAAVAEKGAASIARQTPSTKNGTRVRVLAGSAFADFAQAGKLLASAIRDVRAGKTGSAVTARVNRAVRLASEGRALLEQAGKIIPKLL